MSRSNSAAATQADLLGLRTTLTNSKDTQAGIWLHYNSAQAFSFAAGTVSYSNKLLLSGGVGVVGKTGLYEVQVTTQYAAAAPPPVVTLTVTNTTTSETTVYAPSLLGTPTTNADTTHSGVLKAWVPLTSSRDTFVLACETSGISNVIISRAM